MVTAGIVVADAVVDAFNDLRLKHTSRYLVLKIEGEKTVELEMVGETDEKFDHETFVNNIIQHINEPRFIIFDFHATDSENRNLEKVCLISWVPDKCKIKMRMLHASTLEDVKKKLQGIAVTVHASGKSDLDVSEFKRELKIR